MWGTKDRRTRGSQPIGAVARANPMNARACADVGRKWAHFTRSSVLERAISPGFGADWGGNSSFWADWHRNGYISS